MKPIQSEEREIDLYEDQGTDLATVKAFLEYHGFIFEEDSDNGITPYLRINFDDKGNAV
jgi:hypothetical protein